MPDQTEIEIKLRLPESALAVLNRHPALQPPRAGEPTTRAERSVYFDTPDFRLAREGLVLRVRRANGRAVQTVKSKRGGNNGFGRGEWESRITGTRPDPARFVGTPLASLPKDVTAQLAPLFSTAIRRTRRTLHLPGGTEVEAALDEGEIVAGGSRELVLELELELKAGEAGPLFQLALELQGELSLTLGPDTKAARGYRLCQAELPGTEKAPRLELPEGAPAAAAFRAMLGNALHHLLANHAAAEAGAAEGVHQMRIALRRLRSLLVLFDGPLGSDETERFSAGLRDTGHVLSKARDWDVFSTETLPEAMSAAESDPARLAALQLLQPAADDRRRAAHHQVQALLQAPEFSRLALELAGWAAGHLNKLDEMALPDLAPDLLERLVRKASKRGRRLRKAKSEALHGFRKSVKKVRYGLEFIASVLPEPRADKLRKRCKAVLNPLGTFNDASVAEHLATQLADDQPELRESAMALAEWASGRRKATRQKLPRLAKRWKRQAADWT